MNNTYIIGSSIISALGQNKHEAVNKIKSINDNNYQDYIDNTYTDKNFYFINNTSNKKDRFFEILKSVILEALEDAKIPISEYPNLCVSMGSTSLGISVLEDEYVNSNQIKQVGSNFILDYIDDLLKLKHSTLIFSTACTSSANALSYCNDEVSSKRSKYALVIGLELFNDSTYNGFESLMLLSKNGIYKPLQEDSDGIILGEACSAVVLSAQNKDDAFKFVASNNVFDDYSDTSSNPNGHSIYKSSINTLNASNLSIDNIDIVLAHTPGSLASNEAELNGLLKLNTKSKVCSLKPYIGHTLGACSLNEIVLMLSCIKDGFLPHTQGINSKFTKLEFTKYENINEKLNILFTYNGFSGNNISLLLSNKD